MNKSDKGAAHMNRRRFLESLGLGAAAMSLAGCGREAHAENLKWSWIDRSLRFLGHGEK